MRRGGRGGRSQSRHDNRGESRSGAHAHVFDRSAGKPGLNRADALVTGWGVSTVAALVLSVLGLRGPRGAKGFAAYGLLFGIVSILVLALVGAASAAGMDPGAACGGG